MADQFQYAVFLSHSSNDKAAVRELAERLRADGLPYVVGQKLKGNPDIRFTRDLRTELQERVWKVAQAWKAGKSHLE